MLDVCLDIHKPNEAGKSLEITCNGAAHRRNLRMDVVNGPFIICQLPFRQNTEERQGDQLELVNM